MVFFIYTDRLADYPDVNELGTLLPELVSLATQYKLSGFQSCLEVRDVSNAFLIDINPDIPYFKVATSQCYCAEFTGRRLSSRRPRGRNKELHHLPLQAG